ncbi:protein of unknown function [Nitrospira japonica]|uniref:Uncharacterized protein n=1 Tax=Nitrospira japonica TaxID=1325564 RepID=A0A1W1I5X9_9BACT|nr:protein of unknown function [Nitrospira japonica]
MAGLIPSHWHYPHYPAYFLNTIPADIARDEGGLPCSSVSQLRKGQRECRFTATGTCDRLLMGIKVVDEFGGGHPLPDLFRPTILVKLLQHRRESTG